MQPSYHYGNAEVKGVLPCRLTTVAEAASSLANMVAARIGPKHPVKVYLQEWRVYFQLTQDQMASRLDTTKTTVSRKENDKRKLDVNFVAAYAEALGRRAEDMFRHPEQPSADELMRGMAPDQRQLAIDVVETMKRRTGTAG